MQGYISACCFSVINSRKKKEYDEKRYDEPFDRRDCFFHNRFPILGNKTYCYAHYKVLNSYGRFASLAILNVYAPQGETLKTNIKKLR